MSDAYYMQRNEIIIFYFFSLKTLYLLPATIDIFIFRFIN